MSTNLEIRPYQPGDEGAILQLFEQSFGRPMGLDYWNWRFRDNPATGPAISLAWDGGKLAAHYAVSPVVMQIAGEPRLTALSMTTMTHPDFRGQGLFVRLASDLYDRLQQQGYFMVWGFPNDQSHRGFVRDLAWRDIGEIPMFQSDLSSLREQPRASDAVQELLGFDARADRLWSTICSDYDLSVQRDRRFLDWRYSLNPQNKYRILGYSQGDELLGYVVFKSYQAEVDIVDVLAVEDRSIGVELVRGVMALALQEEGARGLNMWQPFRYGLHLELEKLGFRNGSPVTYLGARLLNKVRVSLDVTDLRRWHFSMGDSDVF